MKHLILKPGKTILLLTMMLVCGSAYSQQLSDYLMQAKAFSRTGNPEASVRILTEALGKQRDYRLFLERGDANILIGKYPEALADYNAANSLVPLSGEYGLAKVYALRGDAGTSVYHLELSMKSDFRKSEKEILLDPVFERIENRSEWRQFWRKSWYSIAEERLSEIEYYSSAGRVEEASASLNELMKVYPDSENTKYAEALVHMSAGRLTSAVKILTGLAAADQANEKYLRTLGRVQDALGNHAGASVTWSKLIGLEVADPDLYLKRAESYSKTGENDKAVADLEKYLTLFPGEKNALRLAGRISAASGDNIRALSYFSENLRNNPNDPQCYIDRANSYLSARSWDWAVLDYAMALDLDPGNPDTWLNKGIALLNAGKTDDACHDFRKSFRMGNKRAAEYISRHCIK
ncbi:MAG TPA: tetratricopeptide repeat protein [Bacteroidales bacterium]|jgi:tetratricopeptide (TPR) repeat protein|nr:tetratricopeptide repeat protein [Bacteroidales bacterium]HQH25344.1 tetratricopeptide repeat protein [Bacteroidales bacterium]HQJ82856.1 tetratricopeptide repeat protein [Bacteroidales bacterium]